MVFVLLIGYMITRPTISEFFGKAKVYDIDEVGCLVSAHNKVGWLDVAMDIVACMNEFYPR